MNVSDLPGNETANNATSGGSLPAFLYYVIAVEMLVSAACLLVCLYACAVLPDFRNVHGRNLASLSVCLLTSYLFLSLDLMLRRRVSAGLCQAVGVGVHVAFLATFYWTNVMAFDIFRSITHLKPKSGGASPCRRYVKYSVYAWSATLTTSSPALVSEWSGWIPDLYQAHFGRKRCWLSGTTAFAFYFNFPVGLILFGNLLMFLLTVRKLRLIKKMSKTLRPEQQQKRLNLHLKLFLVMGITWVSEFLPWATGVYALYGLAGMLTALHGVLLFAIFVAKRKILSQLWQRCCCGTAKISHSQPTLSSSATSKM